MPTSTRTRAFFYLALAIFAASQAVSAWADWRLEGTNARSDEVSRCLTGYRLEYVDGPEADALADLADFGVDSAEFETATDNFRAGKGELEKLNRRARLHPEAFLRDCRADNP